MIWAIEYQYCFTEYEYEGNQNTQLEMRKLFLSHPLAYARLGIKSKAENLKYVPFGV